MTRLRPTLAVLVGLATLAGAALPRLAGAQAAAKNRRVEIVIHKR